MNFKRTKLIRDPRSAVTWVKNYCDALAEHKGDEFTKLGISEDKRCFVTRPPGLLSSHGFVKPVVDRFMLAYGLDSNAAVLRYIREHCGRQRRQGRAVMAIRAVACVDLGEICKLTKNIIAVDLALVAGVEKTLQAIAAQYYPDDEFGFFLTINHDRKDRQGRPYLQADVFLLPQTLGGVGIHSLPGGEAMVGADTDKELNILERGSSIFRLQMCVSLATMHRPPNLIFATKQWTALAKLASSQSLTDFRNLPEMEQKKARDWLIRRVVWYCKSLNPDHTRRRLKERADQLGLLRNKERIVALKDVATYLDEAIVMSSKSRVHGRQTYLNAVRAYNSDWTPPRIHVHLLSIPRTLALPAQDSSVPTFSAGPDQTDGLRTLFHDMSLGRKASRLSFLAEAAEVELRLAATRDTDPAWVTTLEAAAASVLPNYQMLDGTQVGEHEGVRQPGALVSTPSQR